MEYVFPALEETCNKQGHFLVSSLVCLDWTGSDLEIMTGQCYNLNSKVRRWKTELSSPGIFPEDV